MDIAAASASSRYIMNETNAAKVTAS